MTKEVFLRITLQQPFPGVVYGLQKGKGSAYETVQKQIAGADDLVWECKVTVKQAAHGNSVFLGPFVQGTPLDRFIYIDIGSYAGQSGTPWNRRLKIPLAGITMEMLNRLSDKHVLLTRVPGTGKDGGPNCGTVKPFDGWKIAGAEKN